MITKEKIVLISIIILSTLGVMTLGILRSAKHLARSERVYAQALADYDKGDFQNAYYLFSHVSNSSVLKPAAMYRQGRCADILADERTALRAYKNLVRRFPQSVLSQRAKYLIAQIYFGKNNRKSEKYFKEIIKKYPQSDYAIAAGYYIGVLEVQRAQNTKGKAHAKLVDSAQGHFRTYIETAPAGRYSQEAIKELETIAPLTDEDVTLAAKSFIALENWAQAEKYLLKIPFEKSWAILVQCEKALGENDKVNEHTLLGLQSDSLLPKDEDIHKAVDAYLSNSTSRENSINYLLSFGEYNGYDYVLYLKCNSMTSAMQDACFNTLYTKYPDGQFSAEALANIFYSKIKQGEYLAAKSIGRKHLSKFITTNSAPRVMYWLGKVSERTKHYEDATGYYKSVISKFPDDYYAYKAYTRLNKVYNTLFRDTLDDKPVMFPYKEQSELVKALIRAKDYSLISELYKDDDFVRSWLAYMDGDYSHSAVVARDAMEKLSPKPDKNDLRWRLVYPLHYMIEIRKAGASLGNNEIMIEALIREESYFNPKAKSVTGARGLMQLMPETAKEVGVGLGIVSDNADYLFDEQMNIRLGNLYYSRLRGAFLDKDTFAVMAYNGGMGSLAKWQQYLAVNDLDEFVEQIPYNETKNYVRKVFRSYWNYARIY